MPGTDPSTWAHDGASSFDLLVLIADAAEAALTQTYDGAPAESFIGWNIPPDDCCDFVALNIRDEAPHMLGAFPQNYSGADGTAAQCSVDMSIGLRLSVRRKCQPMPTNNPASPFPSAEAKTKAAARMFADMRALTCIWKPQTRGFVDAHENEAGWLTQWGTLASRAQAGDCAGFDWDFRIGI